MILFDDIYANSLKDIQVLNFEASPYTGQAELRSGG